MDRADGLTTHANMQLHLKEDGRTEEEAAAVAGTVLQEEQAGDKAAADGLTVHASMQLQRSADGTTAID